MEIIGGYLVEQFEKDQYVILIVDEAQNLPLETLEEIRMLSNLDADKEPLLQTILVGQPSLRQKLGWQGLRQLSQRIQVSYHLEPLDKKELKDYIQYRLKQAGGENPELFTQGALETIYQYTSGVPRIINAVCHMCLVYGMAEDFETIDRSLVESVIEDRSRWGLHTVDESRPDDAIVDPLLLAVETENVWKMVMWVESRLDRFIEISEASKNALEAIAASIAGTASQEEISILNAKLTEVKNGREALQKRIEQLENSLNTIARSQQQLLVLLQNKKNEPTSLERNTPRFSITGK
jgi:hypothetical protein